MSHRIAFIDEECIDVTGIVLFGIQAAVPTQFSGLRGVHAQARRDARPACPSERLQAHMGSRAAPTAQPLRAQSGGRPLGITRASTLAGDRASQAGAAAAPRTLVDGPKVTQYLYGRGLFTPCECKAPSCERSYTYILSARLETVSDALPTTWKLRGAAAAAVNGSLNGPDQPIHLPPVAKYG